MVYLEVLRFLSSYFGSFYVLLSQKRKQSSIKIDGPAVQPFTEKRGSVLRMIPHIEETWVKNGTYEKAIVQKTVNQAETGSLSE